MQAAFKHIAIAVVCLVTVFLSQSSAQPPGPAADAIGTAWKARASAATKRLGTAGLDKCDKGLELAFQQFNEVTSGRQRSFELLIEIDNQAMVASYTYEDPRMTSFALLAVPPGWLVVQKPDNRALNILIAAANCSFELCTIDPFASGACAEQQSR